MKRTEPKTDLPTDLTSKILVVGKTGTGKTSFVKKCGENFFHTYHRKSQEIEFATKSIDNGAKSHKFRFWDFPDQAESFDETHFQGAMGLFIVADGWNLSTIDDAIKWKYVIDSKYTLPNGERIPCILLLTRKDKFYVGGSNNKTELQREFSSGPNDFCKYHGFKSRFFISNSTGENINDALTLMKTLIEEYYTICGYEEYDSSTELSSMANPIFDTKLELQLVRQSCYLYQAKNDYLQIFINNNLKPSLDLLELQYAKIMSGFYYSVPETYQEHALLKFELLAKPTVQEKCETLKAMANKSGDDYKFLVQEMRKLLDKANVSDIYWMLIGLPNFQ